MKGSDLMDMATDHLNKIGLNLSVGKSGVFGVKKRGKSWITTETVITVGEEILKNFSVEEDIRYLGATFRVGSGLANDTNDMKLVEGSERVARLPLKPRQKIILLSKYVLPGYYHLLIGDPLPKQNKKPR